MIASISKPRLTLRPQFKIPSPYRAWCHHCDLGFMSIDDLQRHTKEKLATHQQRRQ